MRRRIRRAGWAMPRARSGPTGLIATYNSYEDARAAVSRLAQRRFPVHRVSIAAAGATMVERLDGRPMAGLVPATGIGAVAGASTGLVLSLVDWVQAAVPLLWAVVVGFVVGALAGAVTGLVGSLLDRDHRMPWSVASVEAERFDLLSDQALAAVAAGLLDEDGER
jgi:hypothetical protein